MEPSGRKLNALGASGARFLTTGEGAEVPGEGLEGWSKAAEAGSAPDSSRRPAGKVDARPIRPDCFRNPRRVEEIRDWEGKVHSWRKPATMIINRALPQIVPANRPASSSRGHGWCRSAGKLDRHHGDVVQLAEGAGGLGDAGGGLAADGPGAVEAEQLAGPGLSLDHAVGDKGEPV